MEIVVVNVGVPSWVLPLAFIIIIIILIVIISFNLFNKVVKHPLRRPRQRSDSQVHQQPIPRVVQVLVVLTDVDVVLVGGELWVVVVAFFYYLMIIIVHTLLIAACTCINIKPVYVMFRVNVAHLHLVVFVPSYRLGAPIVVVAVAFCFEREGHLQVERPAITTELWAPLL